MLLVVPPFQFKIYRQVLNDFLTEANLVSIESASAKPKDQLKFQTTIDALADNIKSLGNGETEKEDFLKAIDDVHHKIKDAEDSKKAADDANFVFNEGMLNAIAERKRKAILQIWLDIGILVVSIGVTVCTCGAGSVLTTGNIENFIRKIEEGNKVVSTGGKAHQETMKILTAYRDEHLQSLKLTMFLTLQRCAASMVYSGTLPSYLSLNTTIRVDMSSTQYQSALNQVQDRLLKRQEKLRSQTISLVVEPKDSNSFLAVDWKTMLQAEKSISFQLPLGLEIFRDWCNMRLLDVSLNLQGLSRKVPANSAIPEPNCLYKVQIGPEFFDKSEIGENIGYQISESILEKKTA